MAELRGSATLTVSSEFNGSFLKANAVDGNTSTDWASASEGSASWIQFTWVSTVTIREIRLLCRTTDNWGTPRFTFSDSTYVDGWTPSSTSATDVTYSLLFPKDTTSLRISVATDQAKAGTNVNPGFREVYISDTWTTTPTTDLTKPSQLTASASFNASFSKWNAIDGTTGAEWASSGDGSAAWIQFTYSQSVSVESIQLQDRTGTSDRWGTPRFTFSDSSTQDGGGAVSNTGYTTYTLTPVTTTSVRITILSGGTGNNRGLAEAILTGQVFLPNAAVSDSVSTSESFTVQIEGVLADQTISV